MTITLHKNDLPDDFVAASSVAIDTETLGLIPHRDRLCVVQVSNGDGDAHLVQMDGTDYSAPNLKKILADQNILKLFHFGRFDIAVLQHYVGELASPVYCTKIASKLVRTYTDRHGLKNLTSELLEINLDKQSQSSNWAAAELSSAQQEYAASDVLYLHQLKEKLDEMLVRDGRTAFAQACFEFLPVRAKLDLAGFEERDLFAHAY